MKYKQFSDGSCLWKELHTLRECPENPWIKNKGKQVNTKGELVLCTIIEFKDALDFNDNDLCLGNVDDKLNNDSKFYLPQSSSTQYMFVQNNVAVQAASMLSQSGGNISKHWILIDNQSIVDVICNIKSLNNVRTVNEGLTIHCNTGITRTNQVGELNGYGTVWYYSDGIANISSFHLVSDTYHVQYNNYQSNAFTVWKDDCTE